MPAQFFGVPTNGKPVPQPIQDAITQGINDWATTHDPQVSSAWQKGDADTLKAAKEYADKNGAPLALSGKAELGATNLDTVTDFGFYPQSISSNATVANGYPPNEYRGELIVWSHPNRPLIIQEYVGSFTGKRYIREKNGTAAWTAWSSGDLTARQALTASDNLNTFVTRGIYGNASVGAATTANNYPVADRGLLTVLVVGGTNVYQKFEATRLGQVFIREKYDNVWSTWKLVGGDYAALDRRVSTVETTAGTLDTRVSKLETNPAPATVTADAPGPYERDTRLFELRDRRGRIRTTGKGVVALVFDHGEVAFRDVVLPLLKKHGLTATLAVNAGRLEDGYMHAASTGGVDWATIKQWGTTDGIEIASHGWTHRGATGDANIRKELVLAADEIEARAGVKVDTYAQIGIPAGDPDFDGFAGGSTYKAYWETYAGRALLARYPVVLGAIPHNWQTYIADGNPPIGVNGRWLDDGLDATIAMIKTKIDRAVARGEKFIVRCHPQSIKASSATSGLTPEILDSFLGYLKGRRDAGELVVLQARDWGIAEA